MKGSLIFSVLCFWSLLSIGQDMHSSNIQNQPQMYNPGLTALKNSVDATISHRSQWRSLGSPFKTLFASAGAVVQPKHRERQAYFALGLNAYSEQMGVHASNTSVSFNTACHLPISKRSILSLGINLGYYSNEINTDLVGWGSQHNGLVFDPGISSGEQFARMKSGNLDAGTGLVYSLKSKKLNAPMFQIGLAGFHLNRPDISFLKNGSARLPVRTVLNASGAIPLGRKGSHIEIYGLYQNQLNFNSLIFGGMGKVKFLEKAKSTSSFSSVNELYAGLGMFVRIQDAVIFNATIQSTFWSASIAYDITFSNLNNVNNSRGALELQLQFFIPTFNKSSRF